MQSEQSEKMVDDESKVATPADMGAVSVTLTENEDGDEVAKISSDDDVAPDLGSVAPFNNFLIIWPRRSPKKQGKIIIPESVRIAEVTPDEGEILAMGPDCTQNLKVGDYVYYWKHAGSWQIAPGYDRKMVRVMKDTEIYARKKEVAADPDTGPSALSEG